jgi:hypothetical protein
MMANRIPRKEETQEEYTKIGMVGSAYPKAGIGEEAKREKRSSTQDEENKQIGPSLPKKFTVSPNSLALIKQRQERASTRERENSERHKKGIQKHNSHLQDKNKQQQQQAQQKSQTGDRSNKPSKDPKKCRSSLSSLSLSLSLSQNKRLGTPPTLLQRKLRETERWVGGGRKKKKKKKKKRKEEERKTQGFNGGCSYTKTGCCCCSSSTHERVPAATTGISATEEELAMLAQMGKTLLFVGD